MKQTNLMGTMLLAVVVLLSACGQSGDEAVKARAVAPKKVTKWKYQPKSAVGIPKGLVVETEGDTVTAAAIYDLKDGLGFVIDSKLSGGQFLVKQGLIVLPLGMPPSITVADWLSNNGPHWEVSFNPAATNLMVKLKSPGVPEFQDEFLRFQE